MAKINLDNIAVKVLAVEIAEQTYNVPLLTSLSFKEVKEIKTDTDVYSLLMRYIPEEIFENLKVDAINALIQMWWDESKKLSGSKKLGES